MENWFEHLDVRKSLLVISVLCMMALLLAPILRWLLNGWAIRKEEFENQIQDGSLKLYMEKFWSTRISGITGESELKSIFDKIYDQQFGKRRYIFPLLLLSIVACLELTLAIQSALYDAGSTESLLPFSGVHFPLLGISAVMGAYLFVVTDAVRKGHQNCLSSTDVYWYILRLAIAIPMGYAIATIVTPQVGPFIAFALGAFPTDAINKLLRRLLNKTLSENEAAQDCDQLIQLRGVTLSIASALAEEGIGSIQVLASKDPVLLACRTALPFDFMLELAAQAIGQTYLGANIQKLSDLGLGDAYLISKFMQKNPPRQPQNAQCPEERILTEAAQLLGPISYESAYGSFENISNDNYTKFLVSIWK